MLIVPEQERRQRHEDAKAGLTQQFNARMANVLNENKDKQVYWILGKVRFPPEFDGKVAHVFLEASDTQPPLVKDAFLYEVDNRAGKKTLLWVMHPGDELVLPTVKKRLSVSTQRSKTRKKRS